MSSDLHEHYDHYNPEMIKRLDGFYGRVSSRMNQRIVEGIVGAKVLDFGCGFGDLTDHIRESGFDVIGLDMIEEGVKAGKLKYPKSKLQCEKSEKIPFPDKYFDTIILKDTIHHIYGEADINEFLKEAKRVTKKRIIVFDPNPMFILQIARKIIGHIDPSCPPNEAIRVLKEAGFTILKEDYFDTLAFPLSGGYVGKEIIKGQTLGSILLSIDSFFEKVVKLLFLKKRICWRYLIIADLPE